jgi:hypothetical protein
VVLNSLLNCSYTVLHFKVESAPPNNGMQRTRARALPSSSDVRALAAYAWR